MEKSDHLKEQIVKCDLPAETKIELMELVDKKGDRIDLVWKYLKLAGIGKKVFDLWGIHPMDWIDKHH